MAEKPKIAMIGDGNVGTALQAGLSKAGYEIQAAGHEAEKVKEVAKWGDCVVLAVPFEERQEAIKAMDGSVEGKPIVDVTNTITQDRSLVMDPKRSGAEEVQNLAKEAKVVKAFNTVHANYLREGSARGEQLTALIAGDDEQAKRSVQKMAEDIGFDPVDVGPLSNARWVEALGVLNAELGKESRLGEPVGWRLVHAAAKRPAKAPARGQPPTPGQSPPPPAVQAGPSQQRRQGEERPFTPPGPGRQPSPV